jgi:excisionase family DNA binding protein
MPKPPIEPRYISIREAARRAGVSRSRMYELLKSGDIRAKKDGSRTLVVVASVDAWLDRLKPWRGLVGPL